MKKVKDEKAPKNNFFAHRRTKGHRIKQVHLSFFIRHKGRVHSPVRLRFRQCFRRSYFQPNIQHIGAGKNGCPHKAKLPSTAAWHDHKFATPSGKYEFLSELAAEHGHEALPKYKPNRKPYAPLRLLTPHSKFNIHSQFQNLEVMKDFNPEPFVYIHPRTAAEKGIADGDQVVVFSKVGELKIKARLTDNVPRDALMMYEAWFNKNTFNVQAVVDDEPADMGKYKTGAPGVAIHDQFADVKRA